MNGNNLISSGGFRYITGENKENKQSVNKEQVTLQPTSINNFNNWPSHINQQQAIDQYIINQK